MTDSESEHDDEYEYPSGVNPPSWPLSSVAAKKWAELEPRLRDRVTADGEGILTPETADALWMYCEAWEEYQTMARVLRGHGYTVVSDSGYESPRPEVAIKRQAADRMAKYARVLGMTPESRGKIKSTPRPAEGDDDADFAC